MQTLSAKEIDSVGGAHRQAFDVMTRKVGNQVESRSVVELHVSASMFSNALGGLFRSPFIVPVSTR
jgi:hypothetical protein